MDIRSRVIAHSAEQYLRAQWLCTGFLTWPWYKCEGQGSSCIRCTPRRKKSLQNDWTLHIWTCKSLLQNEVTADLPWRGWNYICLAQLSQWKAPFTKSVATQCTIVFQWGSKPGPTFQTECLQSWSGISIPRGQQPLYFCYQLWENTW